MDYREFQRIRADHLRRMSDAGWCRPVRCRECEWLGQVLSDDEAVCGFFDTTTRWNDYCSHGEVRRA